MFDSVVEAVFHYAETNPERLCLADDRGHVSYGEFREMILCYASYLREGGIKRADNVVVEAAQSVEYLAIELALQLIGAVFVPIERNCAPEKIQYFIDLCSARGTITSKAYAYDVSVYHTHEAFYSLRGVKNPTFEAQLPERTAISEILFSTGTTGKEKGIVLTHGNDIALAENVIDGVEMQPDNVEMILSPMNHSHGLRRWYANMVNGSSVVLLGSAMDMMRFFRNLDAYRVNSVDMVPSALSVILRLSNGKLADYRNQIRYIQFGAAPMKEVDQDEIFKLLPDSRLYNFYGSTESGCIAIYNFNRMDRKTKCIGKPTRNADIVIVDDHRCEIASSKENPGLLASRGGMNMLGYWKDSAETMRVLENSVLYSNDIAYIDADGDLILLGRRGDVINVGGHKVSPDEIEDVAIRMPEIVDCGVIPVDDPIKGSVPKLFIQMKAGCAFDSACIRAYLAERMEPYKVPVYIEQIEKIPRSFNGKLLRRELQRYAEWL